MKIHLEQDSAEVMKAIEQGALTNALETSFLGIVTAIIALFVALVLRYIKFCSLAALCMLIRTRTLLVLELTTSHWNVYNRRQPTKAERGEARVIQSHSRMINGFFN